MLNFKTFQEYYNVREDINTVGGAAQAGMQASGGDAANDALAKNTLQQLDTLINQAKTAKDPTQQDNAIKAANAKANELNQATEIPSLEKTAMDARRKMTTKETGNANVTATPKQPTALGV